jgi:hypothetical protein
MNVVTFEEEGEEDEYKYIDDYWELRHLQRYTDVDVFEHYRRVIVVTIMMMMMMIMMRRRTRRKKRRRDSKR